MSELSPAAKAILVAEAKSRCLREERGCHPTDFDWNGCWICVHRKGVAAALRAAVNQVLPENANPVGDEHDAARADQWLRIRLKMLAIAAELNTP
jgi:hypothetical protein